MISGGRRFETDADLRLLTDAVSNPITYIDTEYRYRFSNRAHETWFGLSRDQIVGMRVRELLGEEDYAIVRPQLARALTGERVGHERAIRNLSGEERYIYTTYSPDIDALGIVHGIVVVVTDITDRRRAEEALRQQVAAFENIRYALIITDLEGRILQINQAFIEYSGYSREEALGQSISILQRPEDRDRLIPEIVAAIAETGLWEGEIEYIRKDGTNGVSASAVVPLRDRGGDIVGLIGSNRDITDRKRAERHLAQAYRREVALNRVSQAIRQFREPMEIQQIALDVLAETLGVDRCLSILIDRGRDQVSFIAEWRRPDLPALLGEYSLKLFDINLDEVFPAASSLVVADVYDGRLPATSAGVLAAMQIRALMDVPLSEDGEITAVLGVYMADAPRDWTVDEVGFVEAVASQLRAATEASRLLARTQARAEREALVNRIGQAVREHIDPAPIQQSAVAMLGSALAADRCYYVTYDWLDDTATVVHDWRRAGLASIAGQYRASEFRELLQALFQNGNTAIVEDVRASLSPEAAAIVEGFALRSVLAVPLLSDDETVAALIVGMSPPRVWTPDEVDVVQQVATLTRIAVEAASISARERTIATHLQAALQPPLPGPIAGLELAVHYRSALDGARVGGDFYDVFPLENGAYALVVGDLSGKGLAAAAQVATVRNMLRYALLNAGSLAEPLETLNRTLVRNGLLVGFATLFAGRFDVVSKVLTYVNCGQEPGIVRRAGGGVDYLPPTGPTLGIDDAGRYDEASVALRPGDLLALYTDGFTEAGPDRGDPLGPEGLGSIMAETDPGPGGGLFVKAVVNRVMEHSAGAIRDDMCLLAALVL